MPARETLTSLPAPRDAAITLRDEPARRIAVLRQRGRWTDARFAEMTERLRAWTQRRGLDVIGEPEINRYDPPWTPWFLRRNEVWLTLADATRES